MRLDQRLGPDEWLDLCVDPIREPVQRSLRRSAIYSISDQACSTHSVKVPSGGMHEIVRSFSNRERRTHWWNLTSSISIAFPRDAVIRGQTFEQLCDEQLMPERVLTSSCGLEHDLVVET